MTHVPITKLSLDILNDTGSEPTDKAGEISVAALIRAAELDVAPDGTAPALWIYLRQHPRARCASDVAQVIGNNLPFEPHVYSEIVDIVTNSQSEPRLVESCLLVLSGTSYCSRVWPEVLLGISECSSKMTRRVIMMIPQLVENVHEQSGGLPEEVLRSLRDKWSHAKEDMRFEAPEFARLLLKMDLDWLRMMLTDRSAQVRRSVAMTVPRMADPHEALEAIEERTFVETHHEVLSALHRAIDEIILTIEREALRRRLPGEN